MIFWLIAGAASGQRAFFVLFFSQLFLSLSALIMNLWAAVSFTYLQTLSSERTLHGQPVFLNLKIYNEQLIPYPMMKIKLATPVPDDAMQLNFNLAPNSHLEFNIKLDCPYRGYYEAGMSIIDFIDIFGIVRLPFNMRLLPYYRMKYLLVYPRLDELASLPLNTRESKMFSRKQFATEDYTEPFSTIRDYRRGDPRKLIHWKATARQQKLLTRQFEQATEPGLLLVLDLNRPPWHGEENLQAIDILCRSATAVIHYLLRQDWHLYIESEDDEIISRTSFGMKDFPVLYNWLAKVDFTRNTDFPVFLDKVLAQYNNVKAILILTTRIDKSLSSLILRRRKTGHPIFVISAAPAKNISTDTEVVNRLRQSGMPVWLIHYGQKPVDILGGSG